MLVSGVDILNYEVNPNDNFKFIHIERNIERIFESIKNKASKKEKYFEKFYSLGNKSFLYWMILLKAVFNKIEKIAKIINKDKFLTLDYNNFHNGINKRLILNFLNISNNSCLDSTTYMGLEGWSNLSNSASKKIDKVIKVNAINIPCNYDKNLLQFLVNKNLKFRLDLITNIHTVIRSSLKIKYFNYQYFKNFIKLFVIFIFLTLDSSVVRKMLFKKNYYLN